MHIHEAMQFVLVIAAASEQNVFAVGVSLAVIGVCVGESLDSSLLPSRY